MSDRLAFRPAAQPKGHQDIERCPNRRGDLVRRIDRRLDQPGIPGGKVWTYGKLARLVVGAALAAARRRANMTQVELARRLGKPQSVVSGLENGRRRVDLIEFLLIVRTIGADPVEIFAEIVRSLSK